MTIETETEEVTPTVDLDRARELGADLAVKRDAFHAAEIEYMDEVIARFLEGAKMAELSETGPYPYPTLRARIFKATAE